MNLPPGGICESSVCFLRNKIHLAAPCHRYSAKYWLFWDNGYPPAWFPAKFWEVWVEILGFSHTCLGSITNAELSSPAWIGHLCGAQVPRVTLQCTFILYSKQVSSYLRWPTRRYPLTLTHRGVGPSLFHVMLGQNPAMHRDMCLQSTLRITLTNKLYCLPSVARLGKDLLISTWLAQDSLMSHMFI